MSFEKRESGVSIVGALPWGSHFCLFYRSPEEMLEIVAPFVQAGLRSNEMCLWVTPAEISHDEARALLAEAGVGTDATGREDQVEILSLEEWHVSDNVSGRQLADWAARARAGGFDGLRAVCETSVENPSLPLESLDSLGGLNAIVMHTYRREFFDALGIMDIMKRHHFGLVRYEDEWELLESTEARVVRNALIASEERYRSLFDNMTGAFAFHTIMVDNDGKPVDYIFQEVNDGFERMTGLKREQVIGRLVTEVIPGIEKDPADWISLYGRVALEGVPMRFDQYAVALGKWYSVSAYSPARGSFVTIFDDITDRKRDEAALQKQADLIDLSPDAIITRKLDGTITFWSKGAEALYGWSADEAIGKTTHQLMKTVFPEPFEKIEQELRTTKRWTGDLVHSTKDGDTVSVQSFQLARLAPTGAITEILESNVDISQRKQAEDELRLTMEKLERSNRELQQFAYIASHDLQEPLRMVASFVQLLEKRYHGQLDSDAEEFIGFAVDGANRMQSMIQDLLMYSRVGTHGGDFTAVDANAAVERVLQTLQVSIRESNASVTHDHLPTVMADASQLTQLLQNLVSNAIKFHGDQPPLVHVRARRGDGEWIFSVGDNGIGIEPEYQGRIFAIFQRLHGRDSYPGTGIGLAVCQRIVERHDGRLWVESEPGRGSTFYFTLPDRRSREGQIQAAAENAEQGTKEATGDG